MTGAAGTDLNALSAAHQMLMVETPYTINPARTATRWLLAPGACEPVNRLTPAASHARCHHTRMTGAASTDPDTLCAAHQMLMVETPCTSIPASAAARWLLALGACVPVDRLTPAAPHVACHHTRMTGAAGTDL